MKQYHQSYGYSRGCNENSYCQETHNFMCTKYIQTEIMNIMLAQNIYTEERVMPVVSKRPEGKFTCNNIIEMRRVEVL